MSRTARSKVKLNDLLSLALPLDTQIMGPGKTTRRPVNWVVVLTETENLQTQVKVGDLVILPANLAKVLRAAAFSELIKGLAKLSTAALLVFQLPPETVVETATASQLPLLVVPAAASLRDVHQNISALLVDQQTQLTERGMQLYRKLSEMSREGQGLMAMTEVMSKLTGKIVLVQDKRLEIRAMSRPLDSGIDVGELRDALGQRDLLPAVLRNRKAAAKARQSSWQQLLPLEGIARLISPIISGDRARGYLSVVGPAGELDLLDTLTVEQGAAACALEMAKAKAISEAKKQLRGNFLEGLLAGTLPASEIERLSGRLDHDTSEPHAVLTFTWAGEERPSLRRLETTINWLIRSHSRNALVHIYGGEYICVFQALRDSDEDMSTAHDLDRRLREQTRSEYPGQRLVSGLSGPAQSLAQWPDRYRQALQAMQLSERLNIEHLVEYNSLGIFQLLAQLDHVPAVQSFAEQIVGPLAEYDRRHRSNLVQTMDAYFVHHGNISQTAESLFIHRNTLLYRLERIQELTNQDMNQADMRLGMHLALKLWQLRPKAE